MGWLLIIVSVLVAGLYLFNRLTAPVGYYGEAPQGPLAGGRGLLLGATWGLLAMLWLLDAAAPAPEQRQARLAERQATIDRLDQMALELAEKLEAEREAEMKARVAQLEADEAKRAAEARAAALKAQAQPEELGTIRLPAALKGPCMELQGCVCGMARQFPDNYILARRYRKWCRDVPRLRGDWACKGQLEVIAEDLRRNQFVLAEKGILFPPVCQLDRDGP